MNVSKCFRNAISFHEAQGCPAKGMRVAYLGSSCFHLRHFPGSRYTDSCVHCYTECTISDSVFPSLPVLTRARCLSSDKWGYCIQLDGSIKVSVGEASCTLLLFILKKGSERRKILSLRILFWSCASRNNLRISALMGFVPPFWRSRHDSNQSKSGTRLILVKSAATILRRVVITTKLRPLAWAFVLHGGKSPRNDGGNHSRNETRNRVPRACSWKTKQAITRRDVFTRVI